MVRPPCCEKLDLKRGLWTAEEDAKILAHVLKYGTGNWTAVPKKTGLKRCGKSCRLRWTNYLRPDLKHDSFTSEEEEMIIRLHAAIGSRWSIIAQQLPGRTDNDVKNHWNTKLRKKLSEIGIDPVTHKPFSQILADYVNIGGLRKPGTRIGSLNKDLRNAAMLKSEQSPSSSLGFPSIISQVMLSTISSQNERTQDTFLSNNHSGNHSLDLLAELQSIKLVTETSNCIKKETIPLPIFVEDSLSSSSSSSLSCSTAAKEKSPPDLSWHDYLLDNAFIPADPQEQDIMAEHSSKKPASQKQDVIQQNETPSNEAAAQECAKAKGMECAKAKGMEGAVPRNDFQPSSSSDISFVEAMLGQQYDMCLDFPNLLEEPFYYWVPSKLQ